MNKSELIEGIASAAELSKASAQRALEAVIENITTALARSEDVSLLGFGNFTVRERAARQGRNPQTGEAITIKAAKMPVFKAGKALKDAVQKKG